MKLVVIVHKNARFRTRKPDNTPSALKSIRPFRKKALLLFLEMKPVLCQKMNDDMKMNLICKFIISAFMSITRVGGEEGTDPHVRAFLSRPQCGDASSGKWE